jgi:hypothetical protein
MISPISKARRQIKFYNHSEAKLELKFYQNLEPRPDFVVKNLKKQTGLTQLQFPAGFKF